MFPEGPDPGPGGQPPPAAAAARPTATGLTDRQVLVLSHLGADATPVDAIIDRTALPAHVVLQELTFLSLKGQVRRVDGQTFARRTAPGATPA